MGDILLMLWAPCAVGMPRDQKNEGLSPGPPGYRINLAFTNANFSGDRQQACACIGGSSVVMKCSTLCLVDGWENLGTTMSGNSESNISYC